MRLQLGTQVLVKISNWLIKRKEISLNTLKTELNQYGQNQDAFPHVRITGLRFLHMKSLILSLYLLSLPIIHLKLILNRCIQPQQIDSFKISIKREHQFYILSIILNFLKTTAHLNQDVISLGECLDILTFENHVQNKVYPRWKVEC